MHKAAQNLFCMVFQTNILHPEFAEESISSHLSCKMESRRPKMLTCYKERHPWHINGCISEESCKKFGSTHIWLTASSSLAFLLKQRAVKRRAKVGLQVLSEEEKIFSKLLELIGFLRLHKLKSKRFPFFSTITGQYLPEVASRSSMWYGTCSVSDLPKPRIHEEWWLTHCTENLTAKGKRVCSSSPRRCC